MKIAQFIVHGVKVPVPACYPQVNGSGPFGPSPARYQKTIMDRYDAAGLSWRVYESRQLWSNGDVWSMCPTPNEGMSPCVALTPTTCTF